MGLSLLLIGFIVVALHTARSVVEKVRGGGV